MTDTMVNIKAVTKEIAEKLQDICKKIEENSSAEELRESLAQTFDRLDQVSALYKNVRLMARIQNIRSAIASEDAYLSKKDTVLFDLNRITSMLRIEITEVQQPRPPGEEIMGRVKEVARSSFAKEARREEPARTEVYEIRPEEFLASDSVKVHSTLGDVGIATLKRHNLLKERNFSKLSTKKLASVLGIPDQEALKIKAAFDDKIRERLEAEAIAKSRELEEINHRLLKESEALFGENNTVIETNKKLREKYDGEVKLNLEVEQEYKTLRNSIAAEQVEFNRLSLEISFLNDERHRLLEYVSEKNSSLGSMLHRYETLRQAFDFTKGETSFSKDRLDYLERMLDGAVQKKKTLDAKVEATRETFEKLYGELSDVITKGKRSYYEKITERGS